MVLIKELARSGFGRTEAGVQSLELSHCMLPQIAPCGRQWYDKQTTDPANFSTGGK